MDFADRLNALRPWLVLMARLHLDARFREEEASNIAQDVLLDVTRYRRKVAALDDQQLQAWARKVVKHKIIDFYRRRRNVIREADLDRLEADVNESFHRLGELVAASDPSPSQQTIRAEEILRLSAALERLPAANREVVVLKDLAGWPLREIAAKLDCTLGIVAGRLRRGREQLAAELRHEHD